MKTILVTGAAGLIGSAVSKKLKETGFKVIECDIRFIDRPLCFFSSDIKSVLEQCDGIIHLAAISRVIHGEQHPKLCSKVNIDGTQKFIDTYKQLKNKPWLIYASSREVYGEQHFLPVLEDAQYNAVNKYAEGKVIVETEINRLKNLGFNVMNLRFSNVYGGMLDHYDRVVPAFCLKALKNETLRVDGKDCVFDFTYIDDVVDGIYRAVNMMFKSIKIDLNAIHFTTGVGTSLEQLVNVVLGITNSKSNIEYNSPRNFDVSRFYGSTENAKNILGWEPQYLLEKGISKFIWDLKNSNNNCPYNISMEIYEDIKSYSWLPALL